MKVLLSFALVALGFIVQILVMINGWGVPPVDWLWIVGGGLAAFLLNAFGLAISNMD